MYLCFAQDEDLVICVCWCVDWLIGSLSNAEYVSQGAEAVLLERVNAVDSMVVVVPTSCFFVCVVLDGFFKLIF